MKKILLVFFMMFGMLFSNIPVTEDGIENGYKLDYIKLPDNAVVNVKEDFILSYLSEINEFGSSLSESDSFFLYKLYAGYLYYMDKNFPKQLATNSIFIKNNYKAFREMMDNFDTVEKEVNIKFLDEEELDQYLHDWNDDKVKNLHDFSVEMIDFIQRKGQCTPEDCEKLYEKYSAFQVKVWTYIRTQVMNREPADNE